MPLYDIGEFRMGKDFIVAEGRISTALQGAQFIVQLDNNHEVLAYLAGKMRIGRSKFVVGDRVVVEISPYDLSKGRIIRRLR